MCLGMHRHSIAYGSDGSRRHNQPFNPTAYAPEFLQGDVIGIGYRPRSGTIFFTRNGKKLDDVAHGLKTQNFFPTVGANGPCRIHVNFGQLGFVFIEANVKKWGLAPASGSLAPPPPYGSEQGSILLEGGRDIGRDTSIPHVLTGPFHYGHGRSNSNQLRLGTRPPPSPGPQRSPTDISLAQLSLVDSHNDDGGEGSSASGPNRGGLITFESGDAPPPDYESPKSSPDTEENPQDPPIPTYDSVIAEGRRHRQEPRR